MMILGVVLHSAAIYTLNGTWRVHDGVAQSVIFDKLILGIHVFRMPCFFIISGLLFANSALRYGAVDAFKSRLPRLLIPFFSTLILFNTAESIIRFFAGGAQNLKIFFINEIASGRWIGHLWFLVFLQAYVLLASVLLGYFPSIGKLRLNSKFVIIIPIVAPLFDVARLAFGKFVPSIYSSVGMLSLNEWFHYLPFFSIGCLIGFDRELVSTFGIFRKLHIVLATACPFFIYSVLPSINHPTLARVTVEYVSSMLAWLICIALFWGAKRYLFNPSNFGKLISESSYSVYLLHQSIVVAIGAMLLSLSIPVWMKFAIVVIATFSLTLLLHSFLIRRNRLLALLFNGLLLRKTL
jgi:glucans biosynthesis protein C